MITQNPVPVSQELDGLLGFLLYHRQRPRPEEVYEVLPHLVCRSYLKHIGLWFLPLKQELAASNPVRCCNLTNHLKLPEARSRW